MTGEERRRKMKEEMKAAHKADLKKKKEFLEGMKRMRHTQQMNEAISNITDGLLQDDSDDWIQKLNEDSAMSEARMELAFDSEDTVSKELDNLAKQAAVEKFNAEQLVTNMKKELGMDPPVEDEVSSTTDMPNSEAPSTGEDEGRKLGDF
ncbi:hypothetical protein [Pontibacter sp. G13]|uniref:hypothetical protein n=1 Tax=Pontibacter sp. G13 TaxID=3074898 RepID=UPI0028894A5D|nr:hypothetical protein [Pontibacter sp. G13]WNJ21505.1 hypothetical protein RJD25_13630 [Pontibacter sp. G13]